MFRPLYLLRANTLYVHKVLKEFCEFVQVCHDQIDTM